MMFLLLFAFILNTCFKYCFCCSVLNISLTYIAPQKPSKALPPLLPLEKSTNRYSTAEKVFQQLIPSCILLFFGNPYETPLFNRFHEICHSQSDIGLCIKIHLYTPYYSSFRYIFSLIGGLERLVTSTSQKRFSKSCIVILHTLSDIPPPPSENVQYGFENTPMEPEWRSILFQTIEVDFRGFAPDYMIFSVPINPEDKNFFNTNASFISGIKKSLILLVDEKQNDRLFMMCHTCEFTVNVTRHEDLHGPPASGGGSPNRQDYSPSLGPGILPTDQANSVKYGVALELKVGDLEIDNINALWNKLHSNLQAFGDGSNIDNLPLNDNSFDDTCGRIPQGMYDYANRLLYQNLIKRSSSSPAADPQKMCLYNVILHKHNFSGMSERFYQALRSKNLARIIEMPHFEMAPEFPDEDENMYPSWSTGVLEKVYIAEGISVQGFHYSIFVSKKFLKQEYDLKALSRPLDEYVWGLLFVTLCSLWGFLKFLKRFSDALNILAILFEQSVNIHKSTKNADKLVLLITLWILTTIQLRMAYTANNYSFLTIRTPPRVPRNLKEIVNDHGGGSKYGVYATATDFAELHEYINYKLDKVSKNGDAIKFWSNFYRDLQILNEFDLQNVLMNKTASQMTASLDNYNKHYARFVLLSKNDLSKESKERWETDKQVGTNAGAGGHGAGSLIASPNENEEIWEPHLPFETTLVASGKYFRFGNNDRNTIPSSQWLFQGRLNFFTEYFCRDLGALIQSGIYSRWEELKNVKTETEYMTKMRASVGAHFTPGKSSQNTWSVRFASIKFQQVDNHSLRAIWTLYLVCMLVSTVSYFKEIIRLNIPRRSNYINKINK